MQFLENVKSSIYNPAYYSEILNQPFSSSLKYFLSLAALIALFSTIVFSFTTLPEINKFINEISPKVLNYYPDNLEVTVKNGKVSTNVTEPYFIKMPAEIKSEFQNSNNNSTKTSPDLTKIDNLFVIDTISPLTMDSFKNYKTFVLISRDSVAYVDNNAVKIQSLDQSINAVINKGKISSALNEIMPYIKIIPFVLVPSVFIGWWIGFIIGNLIYLIFGAFVIWLAAKIMKKELEYGKAYQVGLHAITLSVILDAMVFWFFPQLKFTFLFTIIMLVIVWVNLKPAVDSGVPKPEEKAG